MREEMTEREKNLRDEARTLERFIKSYTDSLASLYREIERYDRKEYAPANTATKEPKNVRNKRHDKRRKTAETNS